MISRDHLESTNSVAAGGARSRDRIIAIAHELFIERGYLGVSMQQIADASGLRKASLYHHFRSKESLFAEVMAVEMDRMLVDFQQLETTNSSIETQLEQLAAINYRRFAQPDLFRLAKDFFKYVPESDHEEVHKRLGAMEGYFADLFARAIERGEIEPIDPDLAGTMYFHMMMSMANDPHGYRSVPPPPPDEAARLVSRTMMHGLVRRHD